ncbi:hypothetical protein PUN28_004524 [Cardiocondyla obscurior]|uniref:Uncharacterized protein n=1 Tax=Cardiocondyla obscurior TaxID=286306 RepID=A0AAW2GHC9_9HYME
MLASWVGISIVDQWDAGRPTFRNRMLFEANPDTKRLYDDLLSNYNRLIRPVLNNTETLTVRLGLKLSQLIEMNLKNQVMTTSVWVEQKWFDYKLQWDPQEYGGIDMLYVPSENIWLPDIVLYNNADGNYEVTLMTKATLKYTGEVSWKPPAIYKSSCEINVEYFPFDEQSCLMKFGSWTYNGAQVDLKHVKQESGNNLVAIGIDLTDFYLSVEWDILEVPASRNEEFYPCCKEPYSDITFNITMRRKTLFYTVNLIIPCVGITFLTVLVFYLPSDSGEKIYTRIKNNIISTIIPVTDSENTMPKHLSPDVIAALKGVRFIAQHIKDADKDNEVIEDWKFVAMVLDRFFLWIFIVACIGGTLGIICQAPSLYDTRVPVDQLLSNISHRTYMYPPQNTTIFNEV